MIDRLLENHLKPIARDYWRWQLWRGLARCWAVMALAGLALILVHYFAGRSVPGAFALFSVAAGGWALNVWRRWRKNEPDYRSIARRIERSEEHTSELQSRLHLVCRLLLEKKKIPAINRQRQGRSEVV